MVIDNSFSSNKPYLFRGLYEWILDNEATPYLLVDATLPNVQVPVEHVKDGQIVLNAAPSAIRDWFVDNDAISFSARFSGRPQTIYIPMVSLLAVYAQENGMGMAFPKEFDEAEDIVSDGSFDESEDIDFSSEKAELEGSDIEPIAIEEPFRAQDDLESLKNAPSSIQPAKRKNPFASVPSEGVRPLSAKPSNAKSEVLKVSLKPKKKTSHLKIVK